MCIWFVYWQLYLLTQPRSLSYNSAGAVSVAYTAVPYTENNMPVCWIYSVQKGWRVSLDELKLLVGSEVKRPRRPATFDHPVGGWRYESVQLHPTASLLKSCIHPAQSSPVMSMDRLDWAGWMQA